ncbi:MAG: DUF559 domain-containing protein [Pseudomonadota bacterium]
MSLRFASLNDLGKGAWRVSQNSPFIPPTQDAPKSPVVQKPKQQVGPTPHEILYYALLTDGAKGAELEFKGAVPGRKYRIDIAFPVSKVAVEVDGWEWHGKHKDDFTRDRERQNLLTENGWKILRYTAGQIRGDVHACVEQIKRTTGEVDEWA